MKKLRIIILSALMVLALSLFAACSSAALDRPTGLEIVNKTISWNAVENARGYTVEIAGNKYDTRRTSYSFESLDLEAGTYTIRVKARGNGHDIADSDWATIKYEQGYESGLRYTLSEDGTGYIISGVGRATGDIVIDDTYNGLPVIGIGKLAFANSLRITSVKIGKHVKTLEERAFYACSNLKSVELPDGLLSIGTMAFQSCGALTEIKIPDSVLIIDDHAFAFGRGLKTINLGSNLVGIRESAFESCVTVSNIIIPQRVAYIGKYAFKNCTELQSVQFAAKSISQIDDGAFIGCSALKNIDFGSCAMTIGVGMFMNCSALESVDIPQSVNYIDNYAFSGCSALADIEISDGVTGMGASVFANTAALDAITDNIAVIDGWVVAVKQETVTTQDLTAFAAKNAVGISAYAFSNRKGMMTLRIPDSVKYLGDCAFVYASDIFSVSIGNGIETVSSYAFASCSNLQAVIFGTNVTTIGGHAFDNCEALVGLQFNNKIKTIEGYAFARCTALTSENLTIPESVTKIGTYAFYETAIWNTAMDEETGTGLVYVDKWLTWCANEKTGTVTVADDTVGISDYAFAYCEMLGQIVLPPSVKYIGVGAFYECLGKTQGDQTWFPSIKINIPYGVQEISRSAFYCAAISSIDIPSTVTTIGEGAFGGSSLSSVTIPDSVTTISERAFWSCTSLKQVNWDDNMSITSIPDRMFSNCQSLKSITIPKTVTEIGEGAFFDCASLTEIIYDSDCRVTKIGAKAFYRCYGLNTIYIPDSVKDVGGYAFYMCEGATSIRFSNQMTKIGEKVFYGCIGLTDVVLPLNITAVGDSAFMFCENLKTVTIGINVSTISDHAFYGCHGATFYCEAQGAQSGWGSFWNSQYRPVVYGCSLDANREYIVSFVRDEKTIYNYNALYGITAPTREGYEFVGWSLAEDGVDIAFEAYTVFQAEIGTTLYSVWRELIVEPDLDGEAS